jgi:hypothetical protein
MPYPILCGIVSGVYPIVNAEIFSQLYNGSHLTVLTGTGKGKVHKFVERAHAVDVSAEAAR